ncbi:hypothetical protein K474DRAFT_1650338 [Panus rudis PR-1116 ss-1]|nr:hypothetical protein K474DRAFT_1650338 [Panus rudis PR-1116 ss-1]
MFEPERSLLNPKFEGYKLDALDQDKAVSRYALTHKPSQTALSGRVPPSFQEVQSRIRHNHLAVGPNGRAAYVDSDMKVIAVEIDDETLQPSFSTLYELHRAIQTSASTETPQREYPSAVFINESSLIVSDGLGTLYVIRLPPRIGESESQLIGSYELCIPKGYGSTRATGVPFRLHSARLVDERTCIVVLSSKHYGLSTSDASTSTPTSSTKFKPQVKFDVWGVSIPLEQSGDSDAMEQDQPLQLPIVWHRRGNDVPTYVTYDGSQRSFILVGHGPYRSINAPALTPAYEPTSDEIAPIPRAGENLDGQGKEDARNGPPKPPPYSWTQTGDSVTVAFALPASTPKSAIRVNFSPRTLTVMVDASATESNSNSTESSTPGSTPTPPLPRFLAKVLWDGIQPSASFWTWDREGERSSQFGILTLHLDKQHEGTRWPQVFASAGTKPSASNSNSSEIDETDVEVPETLDPSELVSIREALEKYTAALQSGEDPSGLGLGRGIPSLGEGEMDPEIDEVDSGDMFVISWVSEDGADNGKTRDWDSPFGLLSTPFPSYTSQDEPPTLVIKHGVDGALFTLVPPSPDQGESTWKHTSTFSALAFVLASKRDTRFVHHVSNKAVLAFESGSRLGGNAYIYRNTAKLHDQYAKQAVLKICSGIGGGEDALLGVGMVRTKRGKEVMLCLCEGELVVAHDVL